MEELGVLKWIAIIALIVYSGLRHRKTAQKETQERDTASKEAWPTLDIPPQKRPEKRPDTQQKRVEGSQERQDAQTALDVQLQQTDMKPRDVRPQHTPAPNQTGKHTHTAKRPTTAAEQPENAEIRAEATGSDEFDLRQAVVLSEILRPKFDE